MPRGSSTMSLSYFDQIISPCTVKWSPTPTRSMMLLSSSERRKRVTETELVRSVRSKASTAPPFLVLRLVTATTSPSTVTLPDSSVRVFMGAGFWRMARPKSRSPLGPSPPLWTGVPEEGVAAALGRG